MSSLIQVHQRNTQNHTRFTTEREVKAVCLNNKILRLFIFMIGKKQKKLKSKELYSDHSESDADISYRKQRHHCRSSDNESGSCDMSSEDNKEVRSKPCGKKLQIYKKRTSSLSRRQSQKHEGK